MKSLQNAEYDYYNNNVNTSPTDIKDPILSLDNNFLEDKFYEEKSNK